MCRGRRDGHRGLKFFCFHNLREQRPLRRRHVEQRLWSRSGSLLNANNDDRIEEELHLRGRRFEQIGIHRQLERRNHLDSGAEPVAVDSNELCRICGVRPHCGRIKLCNSAASKIGCSCDRVKADLNLAALWLEGSCLQCGVSRIPMRR